MYFSVCKKINYAAAVQAIEEKIYWLKARLLEIFALTYHYCSSPDIRVVAF